MTKSITPRMRFACWGIFIALMCTAGRARADFAFCKPAEVPTVNSLSCDACPAVSQDGLELYFISNRPYGASLADFDLWTATRLTTGDEWGPPVKLSPPINSPAYEGDPSLSPDDLELYFNGALPTFVGAPQRSGGYGDSDLWVSMRATKVDSWAEPVNLGPVVNSSAFEGDASLTADGLEMFFGSNRSGGHGDVDLYVTMRATTDDPWGPPENLGSPVNTTYWDCDPGISPDGLTLLFCSRRPGGYGVPDLWMTRRATRNGLWSTPVNLGPVINTWEEEADPSLALDGSMLYFGRGRYPDLSSWNLMRAPVIPLADFNGDGKVDAFEVGRMAAYWGTDDSLCDIGPTPWGDGIVDVKDLVVLAEHIGKNVDDPTLVAHWALDELEGDLAYDDADENVGTLLGEPTWRPGEGRVVGACGFDGIDDCIIVGDEVLNPADGPFSVLAWIKGGAPGQVIISQVDGVDWLMLDSSKGTLATELAPPPRRLTVLPLISDFVVTHDTWHRVAFVWDGTSRSLYVDDTLVAQDEQDSLEACRGGLYIGCGYGLPPENFFSGLIDDVRIYKRAVRP